MANTEQMSLSLEQPQKKKSKALKHDETLVSVSFTRGATNRDRYRRLTLKPVTPEGVSFFVAPKYYVVDGASLLLKPVFTDTTNLKVVKFQKRCKLEWFDADKLMPMFLEAVVTHCREVEPLGHEAKGTFRSILQSNGDLMVQVKS